MTVLVTDKWSYVVATKNYEIADAVARTLDSGSYGEGTVEVLQRRVEAQEKMLVALVDLLVNDNRVNVLEAIDRLLPSYKLADQ